MSKMRPVISYAVIRRLKEWATARDQDVDIQRGYLRNGLTVDEAVSELLKEAGF